MPLKVYCFGSGCSWIESRLPQTSLLGHLSIILVYVALVLYTFFTIMCVCFGFSFNRSRNYVRRYIYVGAYFLHGSYPVPVKNRFGFVDLYEFFFSLFW